MLNGSNLQFRVDATNATKAHFERLRYRLGRNDCGSLIIFHLAQMGFPVERAETLGQYRTPKSAMAACRGLTGFDTLPEYLSSRFEQIPAAACLVGDMISFPTRMQVGAIGVAVGQGAAMAFHPDAHYPVIGRVMEAETGWRIA